MAEETGWQLPKMMDDGRPIQVTARYTEGKNVVFTGVGDDITAGTLWGGGRFKLSTSSVETNTLEWQFFEPVEIVGGHVCGDAGDIDDWVTLKIYAPLTAGTSVTAGTGEYEKVASGGVNIYKPDGAKDWDLNITETLNANVAFTKAAPVKSATSTGYFDWDEATGVITKNAGGTGEYNIVDADVDIVNHMVKYPTFSTFSAPVVVQESKPELVLPHWKFHVTWNSATAVSKNLAWALQLARITTV
jgi:hypothetical protein